MRGPQPPSNLSHDDMDTAEVSGAGQVTSDSDDDEDSGFEDEDDSAADALFPISHEVSMKDHTKVRHSGVYYHTWAHCTRRLFQP